MQTLRRMTFLARLVLAGFMLALGMAVASPAVKPKALEMVCAGGVYKLVAPQGAGGTPAVSGLECPLCVPAGLPPVPPQAAAASDWGPALQPRLPQVPVRAPAAKGPPPARAPPLAQA